MEYTIYQKSIKIEVNSFAEECGHLNTKGVHLVKMKDKKAYINYPQVQTLLLTPKQEKLLLAFINSL